MSDKLSHRDLLMRLIERVDASKEATEKMEATLLKKHEDVDERLNKIAGRVRVLEHWRTAISAVAAFLGLREFR